jgi:XTP/dITP diphosphohydrolase
VKLLIATSNPGKIREFREMLGGERFDWTDLAQLRSALDVEETGRTFLANACLKAAAYAQHFRMWTVADDSGLAVEVLGGAPGVLSARWAAQHNAGTSDADNNALLLKQLNDVTDEKRHARFVCVLALSDPRGRIAASAQAEVDGRILRAPRGANGFGYDPLFFVESLQQTTAELSPDAKHKISHRGKALARLRHIMNELPLHEPVRG